MRLVVGVDAGGTTSRAVAATLSGTVLGRGRDGPGNLFTAGPAAALAIAGAVRQALSGLDPATVAGGTLGLAGLGAGTEPANLAALTRAWESTGLTCPFTVVGDAVTAFAAGASEASGTVLIAGTGAVAAQIQDHQVVRTADGLGWLLGDEGSGHWLGLQALRCAIRSWHSPFADVIAGHTAAALPPGPSPPSTGSPPSTDSLPSTDSPLSADSPPSAGPSAQPIAWTGVDGRDRLIAWAQTVPHTRIAALAPVVCALAEAGDPHAVAITTEAVRRLAATLDEVLTDGPVVLAGSLLTAATPLRAGLSTALRRRGIPLLTSGDPATAAAWLAARLLSPADAAELHRRLLST
ncbi:N-acetylglucosamine kinase [Actinoplanes utahensis]|uniref:ATPase BadF/BadG/BcrA/BcrD type domain-containing protein n=1 Tax=Actinoplanes utahensis TaxID=1869 RepID=A0A0A6UMG9_ACTUT|nr:BadF/BadG/BcrA/BcrD ATPase family protein [Actinoplanes utahensis]KHD75514.1 hypothetical protein MB27_22050 [Actinoplanes utahensis]